MSLRYYANAAATTLSAPVTTIATSITVASASSLPVNYPYILILDRGTTTEEVVLVTAGSGTTLTVTRGYDSTPAYSHATGGAVEHGIAAIDAREANAHVNATAGVHGITGSVVGTSDAQALTNKDLSGAGNTFPASLATVSTAQALTNKDLTGVGNTFPTTLVKTTGAQTVQNKTLDSTNVIDPLAVTGLATAWTAWTPTIVGVTATIGDCRYRLVGKTCQVRFAWTATSGTSSTTVTMSLPNTANAGYVTRQALGVAGSSTMGATLVQLETSTTASFLVCSSSQVLGSGTPFNVNSVAAGTFAYEIA